jgi:uncharacterized protein YggU (UPF0235/DUF167 family)
VDGTVEHLDIRVIPRAARNEVTGQRAGRLVVRVTAAPVDGSANEAVREVVAAHLGVRPADVQVIRGLRSRDKVVCVRRTRRR